MVKDDIQVMIESIQELPEESIYIAEAEAQTESEEIVEAIKAKRKSTPEEIACQNLPWVQCPEDWRAKDDVKCGGLDLQKVIRARI